MLDEMKIIYYKNIVDKVERNLGAECCKYTEACEKAGIGYNQYTYARKIVMNGGSVKKSKSRVKIVTGSITNHDTETETKSTPKKNQDTETETKTKSTPKKKSTPKTKPKSAPKKKETNKMIQQEGGHIENGENGDNGDVEKLNNLVKMVKGNILKK